MVILVSSIFIDLLCSPAQAQSATEASRPSNASSGGSKVFAQLDLMFSVLDRGGPQPNSSPALDTQFGYQWDGPKLGFQATSRKLYVDDDYLKYSFFGSYGLRFSTNTGAELQLEVHQLTLSKLGYRAEIDLWTYFLIYQAHQNWLGTGANRTEIGVHKTFKVFWDLDWWSQVSSINNGATGLGSYFSITSGLSYPFSEQVKLGLFANFVTANVTYNLDGRPTAFFQLTGKF